MLIHEMLTLLKKYEGFNSHPFLDANGRVIIGYGRQLDEYGITKMEAELFLKNDLDSTWKELLQLPWFEEQPEAVKDALVIMCFSLGLNRLLSFKKMIGALQTKQYTIAAMEALDSHWARQSGQRAVDVALMIREGDHESRARTD